MSVLTWRNVDGPNFNGIADSLRLANESTMTGLKNLNAIPQAFFAGREADAERAAIQSLNGAATPEEFDSLAQGISANSPVGKEFLNSMSQRRGALMAKNQGDINYSKFMVGYQQDQQDKQILANAPQLRQNMLQAAMAGNRDIVNATAMDPEFQQLSIGAQTALFKSGQADADATLSFNQNQEKIAKSKEDIASEEFVSNRVAKGFGKTTVNDYRLWAAQQAPSVQRAAERDLAKHIASKALLTDEVGFPGESSIVGSAGNASGVASKDRVVGDHNNIYGRPVSTMNLGDLYDGREKLRLATMGNKKLKLAGDEGSTAIGTYQVLASNLESVGKKLFGGNWRNVPFSEENQDRLAQQVWEENQAKGADMTKIYAGLGAAVRDGKVNKDAVNRASWADVRNIAAQYESGGRPSSQAIAGQNVSKADQMMRDMVSNVRNSEGAVAIAADEGRRITSISRDGLNAFIGINSSGEAAKLIKAHGGTLGDQSEGEIAGAINKIKADHGVSVGEAAYLLEQSTDRIRGVSSMAGNGLTDSWQWSPSVAVNREKISTMAGELKNGASRSNALIGNQLKQYEATHAGYTAQAAELGNKINKLINATDRSPEKNAADIQVLQNQLLNLYSKMRENGNAAEALVRGQDAKKETVRTEKKKKVAQTNQNMVEASRETMNRAFEMSGS